MNRYTLGQSIRISATFRDFDETLVNPNEINIKIGYYSLDTTFVVLEEYDKTDLTSPSTGIFYIDYVTNYEGKHYIRVTSGGNLISAIESTFFVISTPFSENIPT